MRRLGGGGRLLTKRIMNAVVSGSSFYGASDARDDRSALSHLSLL